MDGSFNQAGVQKASAPLTPGATVGEYQILQLLSSEASGNLYLARSRSGDESPTHLPDTHLWEYPAGAERPLLALASRRLAHPALLTPGQAFTQNERSYLPVPAPDSAAPASAFSPAEALQQISALGAGLKLLHSQGVAHLHVHPENLVWVQGRLRLGGLETARVLPLDSPDAPLFFARDANFLALTLGTLGIAASSAAAEAHLLAAIHAIQERGADQGYRAVDEVLAECQRALRTLGLGAEAANMEAEAANTKAANAEVASTGAASAEAASAEASAASQPAPPAWTLTAGHATSVGLVRSNNEDALGRLELTLVDGCGQPLALAGFVVADGVGGETRGELASQLAIHTILASIARRVALPALALSDEQAVQSAWQSTPGALPQSGAETRRLLQEALLDGFRAANRAIFALARAQGKTIATTAVALLVVGDQAVVAHVGDSRAYCFRAGTLTTLTTDHSIIQRLLHLGQLDAAEAAAHPKRHALYRSLGQQEQIEVDLRPCTLEAGDRLLLCTDGLWDALPHEQLEHLLADYPDSPPAAVAAQLIALADVAGGEDNSSVIVIDLQRAQAGMNAEIGVGADGSRFL